MTLFSRSFFLYRRFYYLFVSERDIYFEIYFHYFCVFWRHVYMSMSIYIYTDLHIAGEKTRRRDGEPRLLLVGATSQLTLIDIYIYIYIYIDT